MDVIVTVNLGAIVTLNLMYYWMVTMFSLISTKYIFDMATYIQRFDIVLLAIKLYINVGEIKSDVRD